MSGWWREVLVQLANLLRKALDVDCGEFGRTSAPRHPSGYLRCDCIRQNCQFGSSSQCSNYLLSIVLIPQFGGGRTSFRRLRVTHGCLRELSEGNVLRPAEPSRVAVDEKQTEVGGEKK